MNMKVEELQLVAQDSAHEVEIQKTAPGNEPRPSFCATNTSADELFESGFAGARIDAGWIQAWSARTVRAYSTLAPSADVIGHDAVGGFFACRLGDIRKGRVLYFSPEELAWEEMGVSYDEWLLWCLDGDHETFYEGLRWKGWRKDVGSLKVGEAYSIYPFPFAEGPPIDERSRKPVPIRELWHLYVEEWQTRLEDA